MSRNNTYQKKDGNREFLPTIGKKSLPESNIIASNLSASKLSLEYTKHEGKKDSSLFIIISGGEEKEKKYFKLIQKFKIFPRIRIDFICSTERHPKGGLAPKIMYGEAIKIKASLKDSSLKETPDTIALISDVDHYMDDLIELKSLCDKENLKLIISNPCFEIWLYYGVKDCKPIDFPFPDSPTKISCSFKTYLDEIEKGGVDPTKAIFNIESATLNAKTNFEICGKCIPMLFSTNMFELSELLLPLINKELQKQREAIHEKNLLYKKPK